MAGKVLDPHLWNLENLFKSIYDVPVYQRQMCIRDRSLLAVTWAAVANNLALFIKNAVPNKLIPLGVILPTG